jgi:hypothetical protein
MVIDKKIRSFSCYFTCVSIVFGSMTLPLCRELTKERWWRIVVLDLPLTAIYNSGMFAGTKAA